ncbi:MAG TPA: prepilin-type N-terminal cleavage/methylation domain-containing protein [Candidatus Paceibacterota bacterium]|nr:prepilin-type N-terminal cleavage/methylation domain-containing protein [Candidatus Paceibacterota bacterium]
MKNKSYIPTKGFTQAPAAGAGFTLIELLVVIAIIGILSAVVLASLNSARAKGADAAVKSDLSSIRAQAELYYDTNNNYAGATFARRTCDTVTGTNMFVSDPIVKNAIDNARGAGGGPTECWSDGQHYIISAKLKSNNDQWCIDSNGSAREISTANWTGSANGCPAS